MRFIDAVSCKVITVTHLDLRLITANPVQLSVILSSSMLDISGL